MAERREIRSEEVFEKVSVVFKTPLPLLASIVNGWLCVVVLWQALAAPMLLGWAAKAVILRFGGMKQSGFGRELGLEALDAYSDVKNVFLATS